MSQREKIEYDDVDYSNKNIMQRKPFRRRRCPIIVTMVDPHISAVDIQKMMEAGMNMVRFKMATFTKERLSHVFGLIEEAASQACVKRGFSDFPIGKCIDLKTSVCMTGLMQDSNAPYVTLRADSEILMTNNFTYYDKCSSRIIYVDHPYLADVNVGTEIFIGGDELAFVCNNVIDRKTIKCTVTRSGQLSNLKTVNIRGMKHTRSFFHMVDEQRIQFAMENNVDGIVMNFVRSGSAIRKLKQYFTKYGSCRPIILSGICSDEELRNIDDIIKESDGIILSRDFLPFQMKSSEFYRFSNIQKWVAAKCQQSGKPLYLSGGVFHNSLESGNLCNVEVLDASNAILDGVSGFVLKNCQDVDATLRVLHTLTEICCGVEPFNTAKTNFWKLTDQVQMPVNAAEACLMSCVAVANQVNARVIILPTVTGRTVKAIHWMRPNCLVLAVCSKAKVTKMLYLYRSIVPILCDCVCPEERIDFAVRDGVKRQWLFYGDVYVTLQRSSENSCFCDCVRVWTVKVSNKPLIQCTEKGEEISPQRVSVYNMHKNK